MTTLALGANEQVLDWFKALSLPALPWAKELLPLLGLPEGIVRRPEILASVQAQAQAERDALLAATAAVTDRAGLERALTAEVVTHALQRIEKQLGRDTALAFERWARCHLVSRETRNALLIWGMVLRHASAAPPFAAVPPPPGLVPLLPEIARQVGGDRVDQLDAEVRRLAPPVSAEDRAVGLDMNADALLLEQIAVDEWTIEALRGIAVRLEPQGRTAVADWARAQAKVLNLPGEALGGELYLRPELPCSGWPSALPPPASANPSGP